MLEIHVKPILHIAVLCVLPMCRCGPRNSISRSFNCMFIYRGAHLI